jgi:hypothetical protein
MLTAQTSTGEIDVVVEDPSGAVVPGARVTIAGSVTGNLVRTLTTSTSGMAEAPLLPPETYDVAITASGFEKLLRRALVLNVGDVLELRLKLTPGSATSEVTVVGQTPLLEEKSITVGEVVDEREIIELPLNGRNYLELGNITAGAVPSQGSRDQTFNSYGNGGLQNAFLLDGARNVNYLRGLDNRARDMLRPPLDALSQFQVQTANYSAEFGSSAGAVVNAITKSGTNQWHGSAYDFLRNDNMDANNYFAKGSQPLFVQNQYGGSVGAPVIKNRAWIFAAYEGFHNRSETVTLATVPTLAMRAGNFGTTSIYDPASTAPNPSGSGDVRTLFPGNTIPASRFDPMGQKILDFYPLPNQPGGALTNDYSRSIPQLTQNHNSVLRGDWQVSSKDSMFVRLGIARSYLDASDNLPEPAQAETLRTVSSEGIGYGYTRAFNAVLVNELRFSWTRLTINQDETGPLDQIVPGVLDPAIQHGTPNITISGGFASIGAQPGSVGNSPLDKSSGVWDISDNVSRVYGKHLLRFGTDLQAIRPTTFAALNGRGTLGFTGVFTQNPQKRSGTGNGLADLILGDANSLNTGTVADAVERGKYGGWYVQDQWSMTSSLTLNLGLRYELPLPYVETRNRMADFIVNRSDPLFGHYLIAGLNGQSRTLIDAHYKDWAPRVGFAWHVPGMNNVVIRSSFGIFYAQDQGNGVTNGMTSNPPFYGYGSVAISSDQLNPATGYQLSSGQLAPRPAPVTGAQFVLVPSATAQLVSWDRAHPTPYVQQWNFTVQKQLPFNMIWETAYVGSSGVHLWGMTEGNQPMTNGPGTVASRRPLIQITDASIKAQSAWNHSTYEGMSSRVEKRFSNGVSFLATFTHGRSIDMENSALDACDSCQNGLGFVQNAYNLSAQKAISDNNVAERLAFAGVWDLPFGPGRAMLQKGWAGRIGGHWQLSTIYTVQSGLPFTATLNFDNANAGNTSYPNRVCSGSIGNPTIQEWFQTSCFAAPASYVFGNEGRNSLIGPGRNNVDFGLHRRFPLPFREGMTLEFRGEAYNLFNHPQFANPASTVGDAGFGTITSTAVVNRQLQMALRLAF